MAKQKSQRFLNEIRFRKLRRATFAQPFIAIVSRLPRNIAKLARGGNVRNSANTCRASRSKTSARTASIRSGTTPARLMDAPFVDIFRGDAEGRTDHDGRDRDPGFAGDDVPGRSRRPTQCARTHFRQNAEAFHPDRAGGQSFGGAFALRSDQSPDHLSGTVRSTSGARFAQDRKRADSSGNEI